MKRLLNITSIILVQVFLVTNLALCFETRFNPQTANNLLSPHLKISDLPFKKFLKYTLKTGNFSVLPVNNTTNPQLNAMEREWEIYCKKRGRGFITDIRKKIASKDTFDTNLYGPGMKYFRQIIKRQITRKSKLAERRLVYY